MLWRAHTSVHGDPMLTVIDTHTHVSCGAESPYPFAPTGVASDWWRSGGTIDELLAEADANAVDRIVVVQAVGAYGHDCSCAGASVAQHQTRAALVVSVDMTAPDPATALTQLLDAPPSGARICGVRLFGVGGVDTSWLTDGRGAEVWSVAATRGITVVPTVFADRFDDLARLADAHPGTSVAIDHCGFIDMVEGGGLAYLLQLAQVRSVALKVTSYVLEAAERDEGDPAPMLERLVDAFSANRLCWGSDHPQDQRHDYAGKLALAKHAARNLDDAQRHSLFASTAERLFFG